jgi:hypothetical protein
LNPRPIAPPGPPRQAPTRGPHCHHAPPRSALYSESRGAPVADGRGWTAPPPSAPAGSAIGARCRAPTFVRRLPNTSSASSSHSADPRVNGATGHPMDTHAACFAAHVCSIACKRYHGRRICRAGELDGERGRRAPVLRPSTSPCALSSQSSLSSCERSRAALRGPRVFHPAGPTSPWRWQLL